MGRLTQDQIAQYESSGYLFPLDAIDADCANAAKDRLESYEREAGIDLAKDFRAKEFLRLMCLYDIVRDANILDAVESVIGPDILCFYASLFVKEPGDSSAVLPWHQDGYYYSPEDGPFVTAWIALTPSNEENGAMRVLPKSHLQRMNHAPVEGETSLVVSDRMLDDVDENQAVHLTLAPGQMSFHHLNIAHASSPNRSSSRRIGMAVRYISPSYKFSVDGVGSLLLRGTNNTDRLNNFPTPTRDNDPVVLRAIEQDNEVMGRATAHLTPK